MAYNVYSLPDTRTVLYHPDVGTANLHQCGHGKITVSAAGDLTSHTMTADGYVVVNRLKSTSGTVTIEVPQNSVGDWFLRRWARWQKNSKDPSRIALGTSRSGTQPEAFPLSAPGCCRRCRTGCLTGRPPTWSIPCWPRPLRSSRRLYSVFFLRLAERVREAGYQRNRNRFSPISGSWARSTDPLMTRITTSQVALTMALFRWPPKTAPLSFPALMCR